MRPGDLDDPAPVEPDSDTLDRVRARSGTFRRRRRTQRWISVGSGALVVVLAVGIAITRGDDNGSRSSDPSATEPAIAREISGEWRPVSIEGYTGVLTSPPLAYVPYVRFEHGRLNGDDGCNDFGGRFDLHADGAFRQRDFGGTLVACPATPPLQDALADTRQVELRGGRLVLLAADGHVLAELTRPKVSARIELPSDSMVAGGTMKGRVVVDNETGHVIPAEGCGSLFVVALSSETYQPEFGWTTCRQDLSIPTGVSTHPVTVSASTLGASAHGPLEPGAYEATLYQSTHLVPDPPPIAIRVTTRSTPDITAADLEEEWRPVSIAGYAGPLTSPPLSDVPLLRFTNDEVVGNDGCNGFSSTYELRADGTLRTGERRSEAQLCPGAPPLQNAVHRAARLELRDDRLFLLAADGGELAELVRRAVTARIELPSDTMVAGTTMKGRVVVDNQTGHVIPAQGCGSLFVVALSNADYQPMIVWTTCGQDLNIPTGVSTHPVTVSASRLGFGTPGPLAPGEYEATLYQSTHVVPDPAPIPIQITAPSAVRGVTARIELPSDTVVAGNTMKGTVVVQNDTGAPVQGSGCGDYFEVLLESDDVQQSPAWRQCLQQFTFPVGESRHPITVSTSYNACVGEANSNDFPTCIAGGGPPPLPLGEYRATLFQSDDAVTLLPAVAVEVVASP